MASANRPPDPPPPVRERAVAYHLKARRSRQKSAKKARRTIERHERSRLWRWWYELCWRAFWGDDRKNAISRERGEPVPESPFIEDIWELAERDGYDDGEPGDLDASRRTGE